MYYYIYAMTIKYTYNITTLFTFYIIIKKFLNRFLRFYRFHRFDRFLNMLKQVSQSNI